MGTVKGSFKSSICLFQLQFGDAVVVATRQTFNPSALDQLERQKAFVTWVRQSLPADSKGKFDRKSK